MRNFDGRVAFIAGGTTGIGYALAKACLRQGMSVAILGRNSDSLSRAEANLNDSKRVIAISADVSDRAQLRNAAEQALDKFGKIHLLFNNAAVAGGGSGYDQAFDEWDRCWRINFDGVMNGTQIVAPLIIGHGEGGHIVNTSSIAGLIPIPWPAGCAYATAKVAIKGFSDSLRMSLAPLGIGVSCLFPGLTRTPIHEREDLLAISMDPMEVANATIAGIRENRPYILTHSEIRDELRENHELIDRCFPSDQDVPQGRQAFEDQRRKLVRQLRSLPAKE